MGVRIIEDQHNGRACLYCSTTETAFGPVAYGDDAFTQLEFFTRWLAREDPPHDYDDDAWQYNIDQCSEFVRDPRAIIDQGRLKELWCEFQAATTRAAGVKSFDDIEWLAG